MIGREPIEVDLEDESGYSPLFLCASAGNADAVSVLLAAGADPLHATKRGKSVLYVAVEKGFANVVEALLPYMSPRHVRQKTKYGTDVMHAAKKHGRREVMRLLDDFLAREDGREARRLEKMEAEKRWGPGTASDRAQWAKKQASAMERLRTGSQRQLVPGSGGSGGSTPKASGSAASAASAAGRAQSRSRDPRPRARAGAGSGAGGGSGSGAGRRTESKSRGGGSDGIKARSKSVDPMAKVRALRAAAERSRKEAEEREAAKRASATTGAVVDLGMAMGLGMEAAVAKQRGPAPPGKKASKRSRSVAPQRKATRRLAPSEPQAAPVHKPPTGRNDGGVLSRGSSKPNSPKKVASGAGHAGLAASEQSSSSRLQSSPVNVGGPSPRTRVSL